MDIQKELYLPAPYQGIAVYAQGQCYTRAAGNELIESVRYEARNPQPELGGISYYSAEMYGRPSPDNGYAWQILGDIYREEPNDRNAPHLMPPQHYRDPEHDVLVSAYLDRQIDPAKRKENFSDEGLTNRSRRSFYTISRDAGRSWAPPRQVIHKGADYDAVHWGPELYYGRNGGGCDLCCPLKFADGTIVFPLVVNLEDGRRLQSGLMHGRWTEDMGGPEWEFSEYISMRPSQSSL